MMKTKKFGTLKTGEEATLYILENKNGMIVSLTDLGAQLVNIQVPDRNGIMTDCILGSDRFEDYEMGCFMFGSCVGRSANRIARGEFQVGGKTVRLYTYPENICHSGPEQWNTRMWNAAAEEDETGASVTFFMRSPDGDQGYPGNMDVEITYTLTEDNELILQFYGVSDKPTIFNMTNHTYFNLHGCEFDAKNTILTIDSDRFLDTDEGQIPNGIEIPVEGTPFDFRSGRKIGDEVDNFDYEPLRIGDGYDHNFVINGGKVTEDANLVAKAYDEWSGIAMEVYTDRPGMQLYTMNRVFGGEVTGRHGYTYRPRHAFCLETQFAPDAVHHPEYESPLVKAHQETTAVTIYRFFTE